MLYSTFDWGLYDEDGYWFILGRTDDVINVAGHRLGTREIEESLNSHPAVAECAVVGVSDSVKGQVAMGFAVLKDPSLLDSEQAAQALRSEEHTSELQSLMRISYAVFCLKKKNKTPIET